MRILAITGHYPSPYKPYYDTQFAEFLRAGHELRIVAASALDATLNEKFLRNRLQDLTSYYPESGRRAGLATWRRLVRRPARAARFVLAGAAHGPRRAMVELLSMVELPDAPPDIVIVHELATGLRFHRLRDWFPGVPAALYYHGGEVASSRALDAGIVARAFENFDVVFTNTDFSRRHAIQRGCPPAMIRVLPVGFDFDDYRPEQDRCYRRDGVLHLLSAGRMSEEKGFDYALEALRLVVESGRRAIRYSFTGDGYFRTRLEQYVRQHGLESYVEFLGRITTEQVISAMGRADALVLSSVTVGNWTENQACAVQEALLMKALVITTITGGVPESIPPSMQRFAVPERSAEALARAIMAVYDLSGGELAALGSEGRRYVESAYDIRVLNERMLHTLVA